MRNFVYDFFFQFHFYFYKIHEGKHISFLYFAIKYHHNNSTFKRFATSFSFNLLLLILCCLRMEKKDDANIFWNMKERMKRKSVKFLLDYWWIRKNCGMNEWIIFFQICFSSFAKFYSKFLGKWLMEIMRKEKNWKILGERKIRFFFFI